jgi:hypothetical protein
MLSVPTKGLLIRQPWLDHILAGRKCWEIRGQPCHHRGPIALVESGRGVIRGVAHVTACLGPLSEEQWRVGERDRKLAGAERHFADQRYTRSFAWVLDQVQILSEPVAYVHPQGAVIWVNLADDVQAALHTHVVVER